MRRFIVAALLAALAVPALADDVELVTGEVLKGRVISKSSNGVSMEHPILGHIWISGADVTSVDGVATKALDAAVAELADAEAAKASGADGDSAATPDEERWKFKVEFGASGKNGNGDTNDLRAAIEAKQEDDKKRWLFRGVADYSDSDDVKTKDRKSISGLRDFLFPDSPWFAFVSGKQEWDEFQNWDRRTTLTAGVGRDLIIKDDYTLRGRVGYSTVNETGSDAEAWRPEGLIGFEATWDISENQSIEADSFYFPDFDDGGEYRITSRLYYKINLADFDNVAIAAGVDNEYDSHRTAPFDRNELNYFVALLYEF